MACDENDHHDADVLTVEEAAKLLRVGRNAVYNACSRGQLPHLRVGKTIRLSRAALMRWFGSWSTQVAKEGQ